MKAAVAGKWGESRAGAFLRGKGYRLVAANYRTRFGEIDIVAQKGSLTVFVEVKLRKDSRFAQAREFVDIHKQKKIKAAAEMWLAQNPTDGPARFDVIEIYAARGPGEEPGICHIENAFQ